MRGVCVPIISCASYASIHSAPRLNTVMTPSRFMAMMATSVAASSTAWSLAWVSRISSRAAFCFV